MNENERAFPVFDSMRVNGDGTRYLDYGCADPGLTARQYAAIRLKVPRSGDPELDGMIRESRRAEFAGQALATAANWCDVGARRENIAALAFEFADAMLAEWEKEK